MNILIACKESQKVCLAFRKKGHKAYSCDIKDCSGGYPEYHIKDDCIKVINSFRWDMIIAHPPCTYLCVTSAPNLIKKGKINEERWKKVLKAKEFFMKIYNCSVERIAIENPRPMARIGLPKHTQIIQPYDFGDNYSKQTYLWLKNLPPLIPNFIELNRRKPKDVISWCEINHDSTTRSKTFQGIANAMATQWSNL